MATVAAGLEVPTHDSKASADPCIITFHSVGHDQRAVSVQGPINEAQAKRLKRTLERSRFIRKVDTYKAGAGDSSLQISGHWHAPFRRFLISLIEKAIIAEVKASEGRSIVNHPLPGENGPHRVKTRTFFAPPQPSFEQSMDLVSHASLQ